MVAAPADGTCADGFTALHFRAGDRYNNDAPTASICVHSLLFVPDQNMYTFSFCWNRGCPALSTLPADVPLRIYVDMPVTPATGPDGLADQSVVFMAVNPECAIPTTTVTMQTDGGGAGGGTFSFGLTQQLMTIPRPGIDTMDVDVAATAECNDEWIVVAIVPVKDSGGSTPPIPPAACPCWMRAEPGGTCPGIKVPILLETLEISNGQSFMQCIDPANYDVYTGRMAYSYCWRYACMPDVFSTTSFKATCTDLERWNIAKMRGRFRLFLQRTEGVHIKVTGKPLNPELPNVVWSDMTSDDDTWIDLPEGGVGNFTFEYIIPPSYDDLSAAVVMDATLRPPPPPSPPASRATTCACPLKPEETLGGAAGLCNSTYATLTVRGANDTDNLPDVKQCVSFPNFDIIMQEMAWSYCWRYDCLPPEYRGKAYTASIENVDRHNIHSIDPATYQLLTFVPSFGMRSFVTFNYQDGPVRYNSTQGSLVINGRLQTIRVPSLIQSLSITYYIPPILGVDGLSSAVVLRLVQGTKIPSPPMPPSPPPSPPSPPPLPATVVQVRISMDFMVLTTLNVSSFLSDRPGVKLSGFYVQVPIEFYDYNSISDCTDASKDQLRELFAEQFNVSNPDSIVISCYQTAPAGGPIARRLMRAADSVFGSRVTRVVRRMMTGESALVQINTIVPAPLEFRTDIATKCESLKESTGALCDTDKLTTMPWVTATVFAAKAAAKDCASQVAETQSSLGVTTYATGCTVEDVRTTPQGSGGTGVDGGNNGTTGGTGSPSGTGGDGAPTGNNAAAGASSSAVSAGVIAGIVIGAVGGVVLIAVAVITVRHKLAQRSSVEYVDPSGRTRAAKRWRTYSMQQQADAALAGSGPVAGVERGGGGGGPPRTGITTF